MSVAAVSPPLEPLCHDERCQKLRVQLRDLELTEAQRIDLLNELAWHLRWHEPNEAYALADEACVRALDYPPGLAESLLTRAAAAFSLSQFEAAQGDLSRAEDLFEALGDPRGLTKVYNLQGMISGDQGRLTEALKIFLANQKLCAALADELGEADAFNNAALVFTYLSDYASALELYLQALKRFETLGDAEGTARALENIGLTHLEMSEFGAALGCFQRSLTLELSRAGPQHAMTLMNMARAFEGLGDLGEAVAYNLASLQQLEGKQESGMSYALDNLGSIHLKLGELDAAQDYLERALKGKQTGGDHLGEAKTRLFLGQLALERGQHELALDLYHQACEGAQAIGSKAEIHRAHLALATAYEREGCHVTALQHLRAAVEVKDEIFSEASDRKLQGLRVSFEVEQKEQENELYRVRNVELAAANEELRQVKASLEKQAREDALTGLYNRRYFDACFEREFERAHRYDTPLAVMICDIDNFKQINDAFSHQIGDDVLVSVAKLLQLQVRQTDTVARYGGEEFVLLMPQTALPEAVKLCERLRKKVETYVWANVQPELAVTLSLGICADLSAPNYEKMLSRADLKLYEAKRAGKNQLRF